MTEEDQDRLRNLLEERRYLLTKWFEAERGMFLAIAGAIGIALSSFRGSVPIRYAIFGFTLSLIVFLICGFTVARLGILHDQIKSFNIKIKEIDESLSYSDRSVKDAKLSKQMPGLAWHLSDFRKAYVMILVALAIVLIGFFAWWQFAERSVQ